MKPQTLVDGKLIRSLEQPFFELRLPDNQGRSYLDPQVNRLLRELLIAGFLPELNVVDSGTPRRPRKEAHYIAEPHHYVNVRPLDAIPESQLAAFAEAAEELYDIADTDEFEAYIRLNFRLPDPELDPDAYWVFGADFDRNLLVLWGCEHESGTSLPLIAHPKIPGSVQRNVHDVLKEKLIGWRQRQLDALELIKRRQEPLGAMIGKPVLDDEGIIQSVNYGGEEIAATNFRPLHRILWREKDRFDRNADAFKEPEVEPGSVYEREIRQEFQLPDPNRRSDLFLVQGSRLNPRLIMLCPEDLAESQTLPLVDPPNVEAESAGQTTTVSRALEDRTVTFGACAKIAAMLIALLAVGMGIDWILSDRVPPKATDSHASGPQAITVLFDEPIAAPSGAVVELLTPGGDEIDVMDLHVSSESDQSLIVSLTGTLQDGSTNMVVIQGVRDSSGNVVERTELSVVYLDTWAPKVIAARGDGANQDRLIVEFDESCEPASIGSVANYAIEGFRIVAAQPRDQHRSVELVVEPDFSANEEYHLLCRGIRDTAVVPNALPADGTNFVFRFVDEAPPQLDAAVAKTNQFSVALYFNERLAAEPASDASNYRITYGETNELVVFQATLDPTGRQVTLHTDTMRRSYGVMALTVASVEDLSPDSNTASSIEANFRYTGVEDNVGPRIAKVTYAHDQSSVVAYFTEPVAADSLVATGIDLILYPDQRRLSKKTVVTEVIPRPASQSIGQVGSVALKLSEPLERLGVYELRIASLRDAAGNETTGAAGRLWVSGSIPILEIENIRPKGERALVVLFTEKLESDSLTAENFEVPGNQVVGVAIENDDQYSTDVRLQLAGELNDSVFLGYHGLRQKGFDREEVRPVSQWTLNN